MDDFSASQPPGFQPLQPNPVTQRAHRKQALLQIYLPILFAIALIGVSVYLLTQAEIGSIGRWSEISSILLIAILMAVLIIPILFVLTLIFVVTKILGILPIYALQAQLAIDKVKGQIRSGADISVQPMIKIQSFLAAIEALFGRRA